VADGNYVSGLSEKTNEQIVNEAAVRSLSDYAPQGRVASCRRLRRWTGTLPTGAEERLRELRTQDTDSLVRLEAHWTLWTLFQRGLIERPPC
jgi:hypothetical protein